MPKNTAKINLFFENKYFFKVTNKIYIFFMSFAKIFRISLKFFLTNMNYKGLNLLCFLLTVSSR